MAIEEDDGGGGDIPEWVVTFGDMMSLLLTFFIMLVSLSEMKSEDEYQAMVSSMQQNFGYMNSLNSFMPGRARPANSPVDKLATTGRSNRKDTMQGGDKQKAVTGENPRVMVVRPGKETGVGGVIFFAENSAELSPAAKTALSELTTELVGKAQHIEVRGHSSRRPLPADSMYSTHWDLAYARSKAVMDELVQEHDINNERIRMSVSGGNEPIQIVAGGDLTNDRVEVYMLDSIVSENQGDAAQRAQRFQE